MKQENKEKPEKVILCQAGGKVSCAACCGLYNVPDPSEEALSRILMRRTEEFVSVKREPDAIQAFADRMNELERSDDRPYESFHHCPFMAFIGPERLCVGCMLHPLGEGNRGVDYRGMSHYGGMACRTYFCPTHDKLSEVHKKILRAGASNWHVYGLVAPETDMLNCYFEILESGLGGPLDAEAAIGSTGCLQALDAFFRLKLSWPFRPRVFVTPGNYFFRDDLYAPPEIDYAELGVEVSSMDPIFRALVSDFKGPVDLRRAEKIVRELADAFIQSYRRAHPPS